MKKLYLLFYVTDVRANDFIINILLLSKQNNNVSFMKSVF